MILEEINLCHRYSAEHLKFINAVRWRPSNIKKWLEHQLPHVPNSKEKAKKQ